MGMIFNVTPHTVTDCSVFFFFRMMGGDGDVSNHIIFDCNACAEFGGLFGGNTIALVGFDRIVLWIEIKLL